MVIYRAHIWDNVHSSLGYAFFPSRSKAKAYLRACQSEMKEPERLEFKPTRKGVIKLLQACGSHANNGY